MYFTQEDFLKIQEWLKRNSIKDSELPKADSLSREDFVTIVQNGHNKKIEIGKLLENPNILLNTEFNKNIKDESYYHWDIKILDNKRYAVKALESKITFKYCDISQKVVFQKDRVYTLSFYLGKPSALQRSKSFKINLGNILLNSIDTNFDYSVNDEEDIEIKMKQFRYDTFMYITFNTKDKTSDFESVIKFIYDVTESSEGISIYNIKLEEGEEATSYNLAKEDYSTKYNNQEKLVSGVNIKYISNTNLLGEGNLTLKDLGIDLDNVLKYIGVSKIELFEGSTQSYLSTDLIVSTNMEIGYIAKYGNKSFIWNGDCWNELKEKQDKLVSGTNIKTINNQSILGSGNITIEGGGGSVTIVNNLTEGGANKALSAEMGKELAESGRAMTETILGYGESIGYIVDVMATKEDLSEYAKSADMITAEPAEGEEVEDYVLMKSDIEHIISHVVNQTDSIATIQPNVLNVWGEVESLDITLAEPTDGTIVNEYMAQFTSGATATTLTLPNTIKWMAAPNIQPNKTYQLSIVNNLGVIGEFSHE